MRSARRGSALILVLIMTLSLAGLAASAIYMAGNSGLLSRYHDKERDLTFALETALELGKSRLQRDTTLVLYDTGYTQLLTNQAVYTADGSPLTGVTVNLYGGYTGDTSGVYVPYITLLATVSDAGGIRLSRRMDLLAQSFARYGLFAHDFPSTASIGIGENIPGRVHTNNRFIGSSSGSPRRRSLATRSARRGPSAAAASGLTRSARRRARRSFRIRRRRRSPAGSRRWHRPAASATRSARARPPMPQRSAPCIPAATTSPVRRRRPPSTMAGSSS